MLGMAHARLVDLDEVVAWTCGGLGMQSLCGDAHDCKMTPENGWF